MTDFAHLDQFLKRSPERVRAVLNMLLETPYFYRDDDESNFNFLRRHRGEFSQFFEVFFGWVLIVDANCARVYKEKWYNAKITESNRDQFNFTKRDDCITFMILLEFFEHQLDENDMTVEDRENLRFRFGDFLEWSARRFTELFANGADRYTPEYIRSRILRQIFPVLERYRFIRKVMPPENERISEEQIIYEALPALYHYNSSYLHRHIEEIKARVGQPSEPGEEQSNGRSTEPSFNGGAPAENNAMDDEDHR